MQTSGKHILLFSAIKIRLKSICCHYSSWLKINRLRGVQKYSSIEDWQLLCIMTVFDTQNSNNIPLIVDRLLGSIAATASFKLRILRQMLQFESYSGEKRPMIHFKQKIPGTKTYNPFPIVSVGIRVLCFYNAWANTWALCLCNTWQHSIF